jgi:hypothetical protein
MVLRPTISTETDQAGAVVARKILVTNLHETVEGVFDGHVHEKNGGYRSLTLAVPFFRMKYGIRLQQPEQICLSESANTRS